MNAIAGILFVGFVLCAGYALVKSEWREHREFDEEDDDENPYDGGYGI